MAQFKGSLFGSFSSEKELLSSRRSSAIAWAVALLVHGGLILAVILDRPVVVQPVSGRPAVTLVLEPAGPKAVTAAVAPWPVETPALQPRVAPAVVANSAPAKLHAVAKPRRFAAPPARETPPSAAVRNRGSGQTPASASQDFVAAVPLGGNANSPPEYPQAAIAHGEQGKVLLSIHVLASGTADFIAVTQSSGYRILDQAARDAVLAWRFQPAMLAGKPVVQVIPFWINFDLQTQSARPSQ